VEDDNHVLYVGDESSSELTASSDYVSSEDDASYEKAPVVQVSVLMLILLLLIDVCC